MAKDQLPQQARVVIIGGGAVGVSVLYHLAKAGWQDCLLLEKNELTAGSTWHAAGNVPTFSTSWLVMNIQRYSTELYRSLGEAVDYPLNYHVTGSIRLAHSKERMQEFSRAIGMGKQQGMNLELLATDEIKSRYPFAETHDLKGALYDPADGDIDPAQLTQALAKGARQLGAKIQRFTPVTGIDRKNDEWIVKTPNDDVCCEIVVNAAGYYAGRIGEMFRPFGGRKVPMMVMSHQYLLSEPVAEIEAWSKENGGKLPLLRDVDSSYYLRQEKFGFNLGPYERKGRAHWVDSSDPLPEDFSFQLFPDDLERLEWYIEDAMARVPLLGQAGISKVINGPIPYTPDGNPLIGAMPGVPNAYEACVFTFGIAQAGGAGKLLAELITEGGTEWDSWACDPRRFTGYTDDDYCVQKGLEVYQHEYAMHFPWHRWPAGANKRLSPLYDKLKGLGAQFGAFNGWERALWFAKKGDDVSEDSTLTFNRKGPWAQRIKEECEAVRDHVGVLELCGFSRFELKGEGAADWLNQQIAGALPKIGRIGLIYIADDRGRLATELSAMRHDHDHFTLITAAVAEWHDFELLHAKLPDDLSLTNQSEEFDTLIVCGPESRDLFRSLSQDADLSLPWLTIQNATIAGVEVLLARVSFAGELGWEVHAPINQIKTIYDKILDAGATPFGMWALDTMRIEKGYKAWKGDLSSDYSLLELGLSRFVKLDKPQAFSGQAALQQQAQAGCDKEYCSLIIDGGEQDAPYMANVWHGDKLVGEVLSAAYGHRCQAHIALAMLKKEGLTAPADELSVEIYGNLYPATRQADLAVWDPENTRLRA